MNELATNIEDVSYEISQPATIHLETGIQRVELKKAGLRTLEIRTLIPPEIGESVVVETVQNGELVRVSGRVIQVSHSWDALKYPGFRLILRFANACEEQAWFDFIDDLAFGKEMARVELFSNGTRERVVTCLPDRSESGEDFMFLRAVEHWAIGTELRLQVSAEERGEQYLEVEVRSSSRGRGYTDHIVRVTGGEAHDWLTSFLSQEQESSVAADAMVLARNMDDEQWSKAAETTSSPHTISLADYVAQSQDTTPYLDEDVEFVPCA